MIMLPEVNMHPEDKMTFSEIRKYLRLMQKRYKLASNASFVQPEAEVLISVQKRNF